MRTWPSLCHVHQISELTTQWQRLTWILQNLQNQQLSRIKDLEGEVTVMRSTHTNAIQDLKSKFLAEKRTYQNESDSKINTMTKLANTVSIDRNKITKNVSLRWLAGLSGSHILGSTF